MAIGRTAGFEIVILMVFFGVVKLTGLFKFCGYFVTFIFQEPDKFFGYLFLFLNCIKNNRPVLVTNIRSLAVDLGKVMGFKKQAGQGFEAGLFGVENHFNGFGMAGCTCTNLLVGGVFNISANVSYRCGFYPFCLF